MLLSKNESHRNRHNYTCAGTCVNTYAHLHQIQKNNTRKNTPVAANCCKPSQGLGMRQSIKLP